MRNTGTHCSPIKCSAAKETPHNNWQQVPLHVRQDPAAPSQADAHLSGSARHNGANSELTGQQAAASLGGGSGQASEGAGGVGEQGGGWDGRRIRMSERGTSATTRARGGAASHRRGAGGGSQSSRRQLHGGIVSDMCVSPVSPLMCDCACGQRGTAVCLREGLEKWRERASLCSYSPPRPCLVVT